MARLLPALLILATLAGCGSGASVTATPDEARELVKEAYVFAFPLLETYKTMYFQAVDASSPAFTGTFNRLHHTTSLLGPEVTAIVRPNNDTLYSMAWIDLRAEPVVLSAPAMADRYWSLQLIDAHTHNIGYLGTRATGAGKVDALLAGPGWTGQIPDGIDTVIRAESDFVFCIVRTEVRGAKDLPAVLEVQNQYGLRLLHDFTHGPAPASAPELEFPRFDPAIINTPWFVWYLNWILDHVSPHPGDAEEMERFAAIGVRPGADFDPGDLSPEMLSSFQAGIDAGLTSIVERAGTLGELKNGWNLTPRVFGPRGVMGEKPLDRAAASLLGLYGNDLEEAFYPGANLDAEGELLDGSQRDYVLRFETNEVPAVDAFWSITMYGLPSQLMVENPIQRYSIGDRTRGLVWGSDGSLELYLQHEPPVGEKTANWLPAPDTTFSVQMRMYLPRPEALDPLYAPPPIRRGS